MSKGRDSNITNHKIKIWDRLANDMISYDLHEEALYYFNRILDIDSLNHEAADKKAYMLEILGRDEEALEYIDSYLEQDSSDPYIWIHKGDLLDIHLSDHKGALDCYNWALRIDLHNEEAWTKKAYVLKEMKKYSEAAECFQTVIKLMDDSPPILGYPVGYQENFQVCYREFLGEYDNCLKLRGN